MYVYTFKAHNPNGSWWCSGILEDGTPAYLCFENLHPDCEKARRVWQSMRFPVRVTQAEPALPGAYRSTFAIGLRGVISIRPASLLVSAEDF